MNFTSKMCFMYVCLKSEACVKGVKYTLVQSMISTNVYMNFFCELPETDACLKIILSA